MKKLLAAILIAMSLLSLAGCGKMNNSGDDASLYPYGWKENRDGTLTVEIRGKWEDECVWRAVYDEFALDVTKKDKGTFVLNGLTPCATDVNFYLYRGESEKAEYGIWAFVSVLSDGSIRMVDCTHEEIPANGAYAYSKESDGSMLFTLYTDHAWEYRLIQTIFDVERYEVSDTEETYRITAAGKGVGELELWDTDTDQKLVVTLVARDGGKISVDSVEEAESSEMTAHTMAAFWQELGIQSTLPAAILVSDVKIVTGDSGVDFPYGRIDMSIGGKAYTYYAATEEELLTYYALQNVEEDGVVIAEATAQHDSLNAHTEADIYSREDAVSVTWAADGAYFALYGEDATVQEALAAAQQIVGGNNG